MLGTATQWASQLDPEAQQVLDAFYEQVITEDDTPVDNLFSAKQQTLLKRALYASWTPPMGENHATDQRHPFLADSDIGLFYSIHEPPIVPDLFISLDVQPHANWYEKRHRSYFVWEFGKIPELVLEIVLNREGGELNRKARIYAGINVPYYVVYDSQHKLSGDVLQVFALRDGLYEPLPTPWMSRLGLGLTIWHGVFEGQEDDWLRWCDSAGNVILTGEERAIEAEERVIEAEGRAQQESQARRQAEEQAARLAAKLLELGFDPTQI